MSLPSPKRLRAGRQMLVEPSEIPFAGAPEALRSEAYWRYAATTKDLPEGRGNDADGDFSATVKESPPPG
jgi:hypothetical protein